LNAASRKERRRRRCSARARRRGKTAAAAVGGEMEEEEGKCRGGGILSGMGGKLPLRNFLPPPRHIDAGAAAVASFRSERKLRCVFGAEHSFSLSTFALAIIGGGRVQSPTRTCSRCPSIHHWGQLLTLSMRN
jgi:hypothetical protein